MSNFSPTFNFISNIKAKGLQIVCELTLSDKKMTNSTLHTPYNIWHSDRKGQVTCSKENIENEILTQKPMSSKIWKCKKIEK